MKANCFFSSNKIFFDFSSLFAILFPKLLLGSKKISFGYFYSCSWFIKIISQESSMCVFKLLMCLIFNRINVGVFLVILFLYLLSLCVGILTNYVTIISHTFLNTSIGYFLGILNELLNILTIHRTS